MANFASALNAKISQKGISAAAAAEAIGISAPGLRNALAGKSLPNARSLGKYAKFLDVSEVELKELLASEKPAGKGRKAKGGGKKTAGRKGKPGRKPGKKPGRKPGKKGGRKAKGGSASAALAAIGDALAQADALAGDALAVAVHNLPAAARRMVATVVDALG